MNLANVPLPSQAFRSTWSFSQQSRSSSCFASKFIFKTHSVLSIFRHCLNRLCRYPLMLRYAALADAWRCITSIGFSRMYSSNENQHQLRLIRLPKLTTLVYDN